MYKDFNSVNATVTGVDAINQSIKNILTTRRGSVPGKPRFGSDLYNIIFSPLDHLTESVARNYIEEALSEFETRIQVRDISFKKVEEYNKLIIDITFRYRDDDYNTDEATTSVSFTL